MSTKETVARLRETFAKIAEEKGLSIYDVEFVKEGPNMYLRVYIDKEGGVFVDDCESMSRSVEAILDENDPFPQAYILEVSSPGIDREIKTDADFVKYAGEIVDVKLYKAFEKQKEFQGALLGLQDGVVSIENTENKDKTFTFNRQDIATIRLAVVF